MFATVLHQTLSLWQGYLNSYLTQNNLGLNFGEDWSEIKVLLLIVHKFKHHCTESNDSTIDSIIPTNNHYGHIYRSRLLTM